MFSAIGAIFGLASSVTFFGLWRILSLSLLSPTRKMEVIAAACCGLLSGTVGGVLMEKVSNLIPALWIGPLGGTLIALGFVLSNWLKRPSESGRVGPGECGGHQ